MRVGTLVEGVYPKDALDDAQAARVFAAWAKVVPQRVVDNARPVRLRRGALVVHTATSAWASVLQLDGEKILEALRARLPGAPVTKVVFRVGALPPAPPAEPKRRQSVALRPVTELPEDVARELARIRDDDLRDAVARAASAGLAPRGRMPVDR